MNVLFVLLGIILLIFVAMTLQTKECFGQDASIRASVGGLSGPAGLYGFDPISIFAMQIEEEKNRYFQEHGRYPPE